VRLLPAHTLLIPFLICAQAIDEGAKSEAAWKADPETYAKKYPAEAAEFKVGEGKGLGNEARERKTKCLIISKSFTTSDVQDAL
jgi:hypothetical protein